MEKIISIWIIIVCFHNRAQCGTNHKGTDIGHRCQNDLESTLGNGGEYSKCNRDLQICICTINHLGEDQCLPDSAKFIGLCRRRKLFESLKTCTLECSPKGTKKWKDNEDWNGEIIQPFSQTVPDKITSVCYDPKRALNTVPDGFEIKQSSIPNSGLGVFTNVYIEANTFLSVFKGVFDPEVDDVSSIYSWTINAPDGSVYWTDGTNLALSNWLRYINTPITAEMENMVAIEFQEKIYYMVFRPVQPGTELLIWYGEGYAKYLRLKPFKHPRYHTRMPGFVGGECNKSGVECEHDKNTICVESFCICRYGTRQRSGICIQDEKLGGHCEGSNGETCKHDEHAECQRGICVCKSNSIPSIDRCIPDETFGGRCTGENRQKCRFDNNTECSNGICKCKYGTSPVQGFCLIDETFDGRCSGKNGDKCELDENAECWNSVCICKKNATAVDGICKQDNFQTNV